MAGSTVKTDSGRAVVHVVVTVLALPSVDADAAVPAMGVLASGAVLAGLRDLRAFVHVSLTVHAGEARWALTLVAVNTI